MDLGAAVAIAVASLSEFLADERGRAVVAETRSNQRVVVQVRKEED